MVDFSDLESVEAWFETQSIEVRHLMSSQAALRVSANLGLVEPDQFDRLVLTSFRAILTSAGRGIGRPADVDWESADSAATVLAKGDDLQRHPVWLDVPVPPAILENHPRFLDMLDADPKWQFWHDWYLAMWNGTFDDWDLAFEIIKIADDVWEGEDAPQKVADEIVRIKAERRPTIDRPESVPEIERKKLIQHVKRLLETPDISALTAEGAAANLERAILEFKNTAPANCLPDELEHLETLPVLFRSISTTIKSEASDSEKQQQLADQIAALNTKLAELETELKIAKEKSLNGRFKVAAIESFGKTIGSTWFLGAMALGTSHFFGLSPNEMTLENLRGLADEMLTAEPLPLDQPDLRPHAVDI